jgi:signal transduction histidine kinase
MIREQHVSVERASSEESFQDGQPTETGSAQFADQELRHELRNALTAAIGYSAWLRRRSSQWADQRDRRAFEVIDSSLRLASRLVQDVRAAEPRERRDLRLVVAEAVSHVPPLRFGDVVVTILTEEPLVGEWDPERIMQTFINVLGNAVKYSPDGTPIVVEIARHGDRARVAVRDQGIGIEAKDVEAIFGGYRTELARLIGPGSGIGLGLSRRLIEAEGGLLGVSSRPGVGSEFWVELPLILPPAP